MMKPSHLKLLSTLFAVSILATGCGGSSSKGGNDDKKSSAPAPTLTGKISIAGQPITGLAFKTDSQSGLTSDTGEFKYQENEVVTFSLADIEFAQVPGTQQLTMANIEKGSVPLHYSDFERYRQQVIKLSSVQGVDLNISTYANPKPLDRLANRLFLLYSLDTDNDSSNGIQLPTADKQDLLADIRSLPINHNTFKYVARIKSKTKLATYNDSYTGFGALTKYLKALNINIQYPEILCEGIGYLNSSPSKWEMEYHNVQQQLVLDAEVGTCIQPNPDNIYGFIGTHVLNGSANQLLKYDNQNRLTHHYYRATSDKNVFQRQNAFTYTQNEGLNVITHFETRDNESNAPFRTTTRKYSTSGPLVYKLIDNAVGNDNLRKYIYLDGRLDRETYATTVGGSCSNGDLDQPSSTTYVHYYENGLLKQRNQVEICSTNTYDYEYNELGQVTAYKHNIDAKTDTDPATINYENERTSTFDAGNVKTFNVISRNYDGTPSNNENRYVYAYNDDLRLASRTYTRIEHPDPAESTSTRLYKYNADGYLEEYCRVDDCNDKVTYFYTDKGLLDKTVEYDNNQPETLIIYTYNAEDLIEKVEGFFDEKISAELTPKDGVKPSYTNSAEYLPSGAPASITMSNRTTYYKDPAKDNSANAHGYYQWYDLDLAEHLNRSIVSNRDLDEFDD